MNKFDRYVLRIYLKYILLSLIFALAVSMIVSALSHVDLLRDYDLSLPKLFKLELLSVPMEIKSILPVAIVLAAIVSVQLLMRSKELLAYIALGGRVQRFMLPFVVVSIFAAISMLAFDSYVYPKVRYNQQKYLMNDIKGQTYSKYHNLLDIWLIDKNKDILFIGFLNPADNMAYNIKKYKWDSSGVVSEIATAETVEHTVDGWKFENISITDFRNSVPYTRHVDSYTNSSSLLDDLTSVSGKTLKELTLNELLQSMNFMNVIGQNAQKYEMRFYGKISSAISVIVLVILVIPIGVNFSRNYSLFKSSMSSLILAGCFWGVAAGFSAIGNTGVISPIIANFAPIILFIVIGIVIMKFKEMLSR